MGDNVPSQSRGTLKRTRSATFSPMVGELYGDDAAPSFMSVSAFGVFANDDLAPSNSVHIQQYDNDETYSNGGRAAEIRMPMDDVNSYWEGDSTLSRTLSRSRSFLSTKINEEGLAPYTPALTPRTPRVVDTSGRTPRCRDDLTDIDDVQLELVGTTLVAKSSNESIRLVMEALHSNLDEHKKKFPNLKMQLPGGAANMRNSRQFELTVKALGRTLSGVLFGNGTCKLSQVAIQPSIPNVKPIFTELQRLINEISSAGPDKCIEGASRFEFKEVNISLLKQQFPLPFTVKYSRVEELLALRQHYFTDVSPNRPQTGQGVRFKLTSQLSLLLNVRGTVGAQIYYGGMIQVDGSKNCSVEEHEIVCKWIRQFFMLHRHEIELQMEDEADGSKRKRMRPPKSK